MNPSARTLKYNSFPCLNRYEYWNELFHHRKPASREESNKRTAPNHQPRPISYLYAKFEQNGFINTKVTFKGCCGLCLAFDCKGHVTSCSWSPISYLHAKFEQNWSTNTKVTFKGHCGLCLAFDCKGHVTSRSGLSISYLHAKFEQNRSINSRDMAFSIFQGCLAFKRVLRTLGTF